DKPIKKTTRAWLDERTRDEAIMRAARNRLVEVGIPESRLLRFPADQVILLDEKRAYEVSRDEGMKVMKLPTWQAEALIGHVEKSRGEGLFGFLVPAIIKVRRGQGGLWRAVRRCGDS